jgi:cullin-4
MFKDMDVSKDLMQQLKKPTTASDTAMDTTMRNSSSSSSSSSSRDAVDMSVIVLTSGFWPTYPQVEAALPQKLHDAMETFKSAYLTKYSGRSLTWQHNLSTVLLKASFPLCGLRELQVSLLQSIILMLFNDADELSYAEIKNGSGIADKELKPELQSLACGQIRVLSKHPKGKEIGDEDRFRFNEKFNEKRFRIRINQVQSRETAEDVVKTNEQIQLDRQYLLDAAIVRVMKARRSLSHRLLVPEVIKQVRFQCQQVDIKRRLESLIEREYLERDKEDPTVYNYLA